MNNDILIVIDLFSKLATIGSFVITLLVTKGLNSGLNLGMTAKQMATVGSMSQGVQVGAEVAHNDMLAGYDLDAACLHGFIAGAISAITEEIGGEKFATLITGGVSQAMVGDMLIRGLPLLQILGAIHEGAVAEGIEEVMEDFLNMHVNVLINKMKGTDFESVTDFNSIQDVFDWIGRMETSFAMAYVGSLYLGAVRTGTSMVENYAQYQSAVSLADSVAAGIEYDQHQLDILKNTKFVTEEEIAEAEKTMEDLESDIEKGKQVYEALSSMISGYKNKSQTFEAIQSVDAETATNTFNEWEH